MNHVQLFSRRSRETAWLQFLSITRLTLACLVLIAGTAATTQAQRATAVAPPTDEKIQAVIQEFVDAGEVSGAVTLVGRNGKIVHLGASGKADLEGNRPMRKNSLFSIASMTKPIVATGIMILQDEGRLKVSDPVSKYLPAFADVKLRDGTQPDRPITIADLVTHTSGVVGNQIFSGSLAAEVDRLSTQPLGFQPGEKWEYSPGLSVAGRIIEVVSEQPLQDFLDERIFQPLGMRNTTFFPTAEQQARLAKLYELDNESKSLKPAANRIVDFSRVEAPNPSGGLVSSARDLYRFYQMMLNGGVWRNKRIVSEEAVRQMTQSQVGDAVTGFTPGNTWGLGWCIVREPQGVTEVLSPGTFGHGGAFGTQGWVDPVNDSIYVLLIQRTNLPNSDASEIRRQFQQAAAP